MAKMTNEEMVSISIIERWNLTQYDTKDSGSDVIRWYRVRKSWADAMWGKLKSRIGWLSLISADECNLNIELLSSLRALGETLMLRRLFL